MGSIHISCNSGTNKNSESHTGAKFGFPPN